MQSNNKEEIAGMISYPQLVLRSGKRTRVQKKQALRNAVLHQAPQCLFGKFFGAMIGNGEVWFREEAPDQWKIITINDSSAP